MVISVAWLGGVVTPVISVYQLQAVVSEFAYFWRLLCVLIKFYYIVRGVVGSCGVIWAMKSHAVCGRPLGPCLDRPGFINGNILNSYCYHSLTPPLHPSRSPYMSLLWHNAMFFV